MYSQNELESLIFNVLNISASTFFIILIIAIVIDIIILVKTVQIANEKNCSPGIWFFLVLFFGIIPFIVLLCLPYPTYTSTSSSGYSLTGNNAVNKVWACKTCGCKNAYNRNYCYNCKNPRENNVAPVNSGWICPECKTKNNSFASHCSNCFREKP